MQLQNSVKLKQLPVYTNMRQFLAKRKIPNATILTRFLLEKFVFGDGKVLAEDVCERKLCKPGEFKKWRNEMYQLKILTWKLPEQINGKYRGRTTYEPGELVVGYINEELAKHKALATVEQVADLSNRVDEDRSNLEEKIAELMEELQKKAAIVHDLEEKYQSHQKLMQQHHEDMKEILQTQSETIEEHQEMLMQQSEVMEQTTTRLERMEKALETFVKKYLKKNPPDTPERRDLLIEAMEQGMDYIPSDMRN